MIAGAKINWQNDEDELKTSLHQSVEAVSMHDIKRSSKSP
jgi:hypothetical protein